MSDGRNIPMTAYPPQPPARKLTRSRSNKMLGGVCAGVANYLNMDVTLVRILTVVLSLFTGIPIIAYIVMLLVVPEEEVPPYVGPQTVNVPESATAADPVWGPNGAPWDQSSGSAPTPPPTPTAEPGPAPAPPAAPETPATPEAPATHEPVAASADPEAPADPEVPNESAPVADPEPVPETAAPEATPGEDSAWESTPADAEQGPEEEHKDKPAT